MLGNVVFGYGYVVLGKVVFGYVTRNDAAWGALELDIFNIEDG